MIPSILSVSHLDTNTKKKVLLNLLRATIFNLGRRWKLIYLKHNCPSPKIWMTLNMSKEINQNPKDNIHTYTQVRGHAGARTHTHRIWDKYKFIWSYFNVDDNFSLFKPFDSLKGNLQPKLLLIITMVHMDETRQVPSLNQVSWSYELTCTHNCTKINWNNQQQKGNLHLNQSRLDTSSCQGSFHQLHYNFSNRKRQKPNCK